MCKVPKAFRIKLIIYKLSDLGLMSNILALFGKNSKKQIIYNSKISKTKQLT